MIYNSNKEVDRKRSLERLNWLIEHKKIFELKEVRKKRSYSQNNYLHLIISWFGYEYGETPEYVKQHFFKVVCNLDLFKMDFTNMKTGEIRQTLKSSSELNTKQMTTAIDRFRDYASKEAGIYLPEANETANLNSLEMELKNSYR